MARTSLYIQKLSGSQHVVTDVAMTPGSVFWVHSGTGTDAVGNGKSPDTPVATIDYAIGLCTSSKFDRIFVMPGHAESVTTTGGITADVAGVTIIGQGQGNNKPTLTFSTTGSTIVVSAANVTFQNFRVTSSVDEMVKMFNVSAAHCTLDGIDHFETTSCQTLQFCLTTAAADNLTIKNCFHTQLTAAAATQKWIELVGVDFARILDNTFYLVLKNEVASHIISGSTAVVYCEIGRNIFIQGGGTSQTTIVNLVTTSTGFIHDNRAGSSTGVATAAAFTGDACYFSQNYWVDDPAVSGLLAPGVGSD